MSPIIQMPARTLYAPASDVLDRHDYGVTKSRKNSSTGGGRAWSEDEEVYLLQTRLQKMPYKHIAAHLKKTELACRLHYHQLSHGSNRRKRTASASSASGRHSPSMTTMLHSPLHDSPSRSASPGSSGSYGPASPLGIQLPSINATTGQSPRLPAILPKPCSMTLALSGAIDSPSHCGGYPTPMRVSNNAMTLPPPTASSTGFPKSIHSHSPHAPMLRLDCTGSYQTPQQIDTARLNAIYSAHRASFWASVAADYGSDVSPYVLEQAWKQQGTGYPISPLTTPDADSTHGSKSGDKTRISSILGIDADPRSPKEREMVRRMEEERMA